ncbi:uncharacterized protein LOC128722222 [Anopheles nili]|uniref:uncharacterized protein LOC128722222 n=1 Tax=Anopheles nili TaxID=185578 RepID=UPI00237A6916|nr:uncharacterized protein LOC128722222 [Anopheles nili]
MSIGVNLRVTGHTSIGGRKYQEDYFSVAYQQTENDQNLEYAYFGIYDGHGGAEASLYAKEHLMNAIVNQKLFWSDNDDEVLKSIREGYIQTHYSMWREQDKWPKTSSGLPSTAGTTASIAFIRRGKIYIGHVGDSGIVLGYQNDKESAHDGRWAAMPLTEDHKPESYAEKMRIMRSGGKVVTKSGVPRVVWNRPRIGHKGPVRRSTPIDEIPFLAVARSLGDLWSYNSAMDEFVVSPEPDVSVIAIDPKKYRCLIFGTDGLWNVMSPKNAVEIVRNAEMENIRIALEGGREWKNPSKLLVNEALERWSRSNMKADNTSVVIIMLDPPGPPKRDVLKSVKNTFQHAASDHGTARTGTTENNIVDLFDCITRGEALPVAQEVASRRETHELVSLQYDTQPLHLDHHPMQQQQHNYHSMLHHTPEDYTEAQQHDRDRHLVHQHHTELQHTDLYGQAVASTSYHQELSYTDSFAESYNSLLDRSFENTDHSYTTLFHPTGEHGPDATEDSSESYQTSASMVEGIRREDEDETMFDYLTDEETVTDQTKDSTYSLTNLQTKSERLRAEMLESCSSPDAYYHQHHRADDGGYHAGNLAIIEHFHNYHHSPHGNYSEPSGASQSDETMGAEETSIGGAMRSLTQHNYHQQQYHIEMNEQQYHQPHNGAHLQSHSFHHPNAYQMERYDYRHTANNNGTVVPCEATCSKYSSKGKSHQLYGFASELQNHVSMDGNTEAEADIDDECEPPDDQQQPQQHIISINGHRIQINEISSSYVSASRASSVLLARSDSGCTGSGAGSGDEENNASSTSSHRGATTGVKQVVVPVLVKPRSKKAGGSTRVLTIFYETRSSRRKPNRNRSSTSNLPEGGSSSAMLKTASLSRIAKRRKTTTTAVVRATVPSKESVGERTVTIERRILRSNGVVNAAAKQMSIGTGGARVVNRTLAHSLDQQRLLLNDCGVSTTTPSRNVTLSKLGVGTKIDPSIGDRSSMAMRGGCNTRRARLEEQHSANLRKPITRQTELELVEPSKGGHLRTKYLRRAQWQKA